MTDLNFGWVERQLKFGTIVVPTIMHSGTHVLRDNILRDRAYHSEEDSILGKRGNPKMLGFHLTECNRFINELEKYPVITTLRHPRRVRESFRRREEKRTRSRYPYNQKYFDLQWREMIDRISKTDVLYVHIDEPEVRDQEVDALREKFNLPFHKDWKVNNEICGTSEIPIEDCPEVDQEYIDFYYQNIDHNRAKL